MMIVKTGNWGVLAGKKPISDGKEKTVARVQIHIEKVHSIRHRLIHVVNLSVIFRMLYFLTFMLIPGALLGRFMDMAEGWLFDFHTRSGSFCNTFETSILLFSVCNSDQCLIIISAFFAYKLYSSLREKDRIKAEKESCETAAKRKRK